MSLDSNTFRERNKQHPIRKNALENFSKVTNFSVSKDVRRYMYQVMATIGLELERKFPNTVHFDDNRF
ncbi:MAG: hypothetical protein IKF83_00535 [Clostridia bacterium]|nr:hypothetical protein [Clostridia bacterium]